MNDGYILPPALTVDNHVTHESSTSKQARTQAPIDESTIIYRYKRLMCPGSRTAIIDTGIAQELAGSRVQQNKRIYAGNKKEDK